MQLGGSEVCNIKGLWSYVERGDVHVHEFIAPSPDRAPGSQLLCDHANGELRIPWTPLIVILEVDRPNLSIRVCRQH
jgi:hypothetical protein